MPRSGSGTYSPPPGTKGTPNTTIQSAKYNTFVDDLTQDANTPRPVTAGGTGSGNTDVVAKNLAMVSAKDLSGTNTVSGTADAIEIATDRVYTAYSSSFYLTFQAGAANTGPATLNVDGVGEKAIKRILSTGEVDLSAGDIVESGFYTVLYRADGDGGNGAFYLLNSSGGDFQIGDYLDTARTLDDTWLRRDGGVYAAEDFPDLAPLLEQVDGNVAFTSQTSGTLDNLNTLVFALSNWWAGGANGTIVKSSDRENWSTVNTGITDEILSLTYANSTFVATLADGNVLTSSSGGNGTWTKRTTGAATAAYMAAYGAGLWVIVGGTSSAGTGYIRSSPDLVNWTSRTPGTINRLITVNFGNSIFVAHGSSANAYTSSNGTSWTPNTISGSISEAPYGFFANNLFFAAVSGGLYRSANGTSWTSVPVSGGFIRSGAYGDGDYIVVNTSGGASRSSDGTLFSAQTTGIATSLNAIGYDTSADEFVVAGAGGVILTAEVLASTLFQVPDDNPTAGWIKAK